jgi:hypothetical protein
MRLHDLADDLDLPPTRIADAAWDEASGRVRRRRTTLAATAVAALVLTTTTAVGLLQSESGPRPPTNTLTPSAPHSPEAEINRRIDGPEARPHAVVVDPNDADRRAVQWWSCDACGSPEGALVLTEDAFKTRTVLPLDVPDIGVAWAGDKHVALVDLAAGTAELVAFDGSRQPLRLGAQSPAPADSSVIQATIDGTWQSVWIEVSSATAHPVPLPEEAAGSSDDSVWRDANGLVWFGFFQDTNMIATSTDGGASWTSHDLGSGHMLPTYSGAKDVLAVLEYQDANTPRLRFLWVWYSVDGGATWARTKEGSGPTAPIKSLGGMVRADGRLVIHGPEEAGLIVMDEDWTYFAPAAWTPGANGHFEFLGMQGWGDSLTVTGHPTDSADAYVSSNPGDDWTPLTAR